MKRLICAALLALTFIVPAGYAQDSGSAKAQREAGQTTEKVAKQKDKEGQNCDASRAGVRCSKPKPKKVWFWGKA